MHRRVLMASACLGCLTLADIASLIEHGMEFGVSRVYISHRVQQLQNVSALPARDALDGNAVGGV